MSTRTRLLPWGRMALEGSVIVLSILLAFAIDAWWSQRNDNIESIEQLGRVSTELQLNSEMVRSKIEVLQIAINATSEFLSWMGPQPLARSTEVTTNQLDLLSDIGTFSLVRRAVDDYLATNGTTTYGDVTIRESLSEWYFFSDRLENQYEILRTEHWTLNDYLNRIPEAPATRTTMSNPVMKKHPDSKFPFEPRALLTDPILESLLANYLIRLEFVVAQASEQQARQARLLALIEAEVTE